MVQDAQDLTKFLAECCTDALAIVLAQPDVNDLAALVAGGRDHHRMYSRV